MSNLHVIFRRSGDSSWEAYSHPVSILTGGRTLEQARDEFAQAAAVTFGDAWPQVDVLEHLERPVIDGVFVRTAIDRHTLDRDHLAKVLRASLSVPSQLDHLQAGAIESSTGDIIFVAAVATDSLGWVSGQLGRADALQVSCLIGDNMVWWMPLTGPHADFKPSRTETLADAGLTSPDDTVGDLIQSSPVETPAHGESRPTIPLRRRTPRSGTSSMVKSERRALVLSA